MINDSLGLIFLFYSSQYSCSVKNFIFQEKNTLEKRDSVSWVIIRKDLLLYMLVCNYLDYILFRLFIIDICT